MKTQEQQVIDCMQTLGGFATLRRLYESLDFSSWKTKTPEATVRRIVQKSKLTFRVRPGLWALEEDRGKVLKKFDLIEGNTKSEENFTHGYYQGLLIEIGKIRHRATFIPAQDRNRLFLGRHLGDVADMSKIPEFTYESLLRKARTVDVIWFNERCMPSDFYEVEHTTDMKNSLSKFYELQDFYSKFYIVADKCRKKEFLDKLDVSMFAPIHERVSFLTYDQVSAMHSSLSVVKNIMW